VEKHRKETKKYKTTTEELIKLLEDDNKIDSDNSDDKIIIQRLGRILKLTVKKRDLIGSSAAGEDRK